MNKYPGNWEIVPLENVAEIIGGGTPSRDKSEFWGNDHFWITPSEVVALDGGFIYRSKEKISELGLKNSSAKLLPPGTILMTSRASIGYAAIAKTPISSNQGFQSIICGENLDNLFALHQIRYRKLELERLAAGSTFSEISSKNVKSFSIVVPPLPEQKKIAEIISESDNLIQIIKCKIKKLEELKISLINSLIHRGIKKHVFKGTELGEIPNTWNVVCFNDIFKKNTYGPRFNASNYDEDGNVKTIRGTDILENFNINYAQVPLAKLDAELISKHSLNHGDIVMITTAECGFSAVYSQQNIPYICSAYAIRLEPNKKINSKYCAYFLQSDLAKRQVQKFIRKGTVSNLPGSDVMKIRIPLPTIEEQNKIVSFLLAIEELIKDSKMKLKGNILLNNSLSQDLLSGRKRVIV